MDSIRHDKIRGMFLGTAVGDAVGLPAEGISRRRNLKMFHRRWYHRFFFRKGMVSDDTEHTIFVAQSLIVHPKSPDRFARRLAWCFRGWILLLPAGIGFATLKSILRLWVGINPMRSGVFSAGNGPAMRSAPIGAFFTYNRDLLDRYLLRSTRMTHTDPKALVAASAVAYLAAWILSDEMAERPALSEVKTLLLSITPQDEAWTEIVDYFVEAASGNKSVSEYAAMLGLDRGITGYSYHTVPVAIYAWYTHFGDFRKTLESVLDCGGDTDTVGAITGALSGAVSGESGIPGEWIDGIIDWPRGVRFLRKLSDVFTDASETQAVNRPAAYFWPGLVPRNLFFLTIVLLHGFRRLLPPY